MQWCCYTNGPLGSDFSALLIIYISFPFAKGGLFAFCVHSMSQSNGMNA